MFKKYKVTIKREFFITGLLSVFLISLVFIFLLTFSIYYLSMDNAQLKLKSANLQLSAYTEGVIESLILSTKINDAYPQVANYQINDRQAKKNILALFAATTQANHNIKFCYAGYENGEILINDYIAPVGYDARVRPWYVSAIEKYPELSVGLPYQDVKTNEWLVSVSNALVNEEGKIAGVISVDCTLAYVKKLMTDVVFYKSQYNFVVDSKGIILVHPNADYLRRDANQVASGMNELFIADLGYIHYFLEGEKRIAFYKRMPKTNWIIVSAIDESEVLRPIYRKMAYTVSGLVFLSILLGLIQVKLYESSLVKPILTLRDRIAEITIGKNVIESGYEYSNLEFAEIARRIENMAATSLRKKNYELELILESTSDGILVLDLAGRVIHTNSKFKNLWGLSKELHRGEETLWLKEHMLTEHFKSSNVLEGDTREILYLKNGTVLEQYSCALMDDGIIAGQLWSYRDITEKVLAEEDLKRLATTDSLTGLWNRHYFLDRAEHEINQSKRSQLPLSLLYIDIDHFKEINDAFGHSVGDEALQHMAQMLNKQVRSTDVVARVGGEEFCVLLCNTNHVSARLLAEKLRCYSESNSFTAQGNSISYTLSIGVASYDAVLNNDGIESLIATADKACYAAKAKGRNSVMPL